MQKNTKRILTFFLVLCICIFAAAAGWLLYDTYVDRSGFVEKDGILMYRDFHAQPVTGWLELNGVRYYFGDDYAMATGWQELDGNRYYFGTSGQMHTEWIQDVDSQVYYLGQDGIMVTDWQTVDGNPYYFGDDGAMHTGWLELGGRNYHFAEDGIQTFGFFEENGQIYYFDADGVMYTGYLPLEDKIYCFRHDGTMLTGWEESEEGRRYFAEDGTMVTGWLEMDEGKYYLETDGLMQTGWLQLLEYRYYFQEDGTAAVGPLEIDGTTQYFTPAGIHVVLVNREHYIPDGYDPDLVTYKDWHQVNRVCLEPLKQMIADCEAAGNRINFNSAYRTHATQQGILESRTSEYMDKYGIGYGAAKARALLTVAVPGTSEHQLGLAVDLIGKAAQEWLAEHCWEYGFILRYTDEKQPVTGFVGEPWHFRYVGLEVSMDMKDSGLSLEEYLGACPILVIEEETEQSPEENQAAA